MQRLTFLFLFFTITISYAQTNVTSCNNYTWPVNGNTYTQSGTYSSNTINDYSMSFGGSNSGNVVSFNNQVIPSNSSFTISFWAFPNSVSGYQGLMHQNIWTSSDPHAFYIGLDNSEIRCGDTWQNTGVNVSVNTWQYITVVRHYSSHVDIYINGILQATKNSDIIISSNNHNLRFGCNWAGTSHENYDGHLDAVEIWNFPLSSPQIMDYMNCSPDGNETGLLGFWNFEEGNGLTVLDLSANGNNGTITGATYDNNTNLGSSCTEILNLTINPSTTSSSTVTACDDYLWNGTTYTASGPYTYSTLNSNGCDSTATLNLTINPSTTSTYTATSCDDYTWNGSTYNVSGTYNWIGTNVNGCDSTATLNLTINNSTSNSTTLSSCDSYTWAVNGTTYTQSGTYTDVSTNASGCTHTETLNLTINPSTTSTSSATACDSYLWNGTTYSSSGTYTYSTTNSNGCDSTATLNLIIIPTITYIMNDTSCTPYTWNGNTYSSSGTYTHVTTISTGCDSISVLNLIITPPYTNTDSVIICKGEFVQVGNNIYYSAGTYIDTFTAANGCDSILTTVIQMYAQPSSGSIQGSIQVFQGSTESYVPLPTNATSVYIWGSTLNGINYTSPSGDSIAINYTIPGYEKIYFIETTSDGCLGDTVWLQIVVESHSGITQTQIDDLNIYPNPSKDIFNIEFSSLISQDLQIRIINSIGDIVFIEDLQNYNGEYKKQISLEEYSKAIYFLEIQTDKGMVNKKLILQ